MEINVTPVRGTILFLLLVGFYFMGGFEMPDGLMTSRFRRAWSQCIILFLIGAVQVSIVDHWAGNVDRTSLRILHVIFGVILMSVALAWQSMLRGNIEVALLAQP